MTRESKATSSAPSSNLLPFFNTPFVFSVMGHGERVSVPVVIKTSDLRSNDALQVLLSSDQVLPVPSIANDIAEALPWMLEVDNFPLSFAYKAVLCHLYRVCDWQSEHHISPYDAHFKISLIVADRILWKAFRPVIFSEAMDLIQLYLMERWGERIMFAGFKNILSDVCGVIFHNYCVDLLPASISLFYQMIRE